MPPQVAWRARPLAALAPGFRRLARLVAGSHAQCELCGRLLGRRRANDTRAEDAHARAWGRPAGAGGRGALNVTAMATASENLGALLGQMQSALAEMAEKAERNAAAQAERDGGPVEAE